MSKKEKDKIALADKARATLLKDYIKEDSPLLIVIKSVSRSGMARRMRVYTNGGKSDISYLVSELCDLKLNHDGLMITGCGMDMTFWLADYITKCLWQNDDAPVWANGNGNLSCLPWIVL